MRWVLHEKNEIFTFLWRYVDAHYFGYMDEEDGQVLPLEVEAERRAREEALDNYKMDCELDAMAVGVNIDDWDKGWLIFNWVFCLIHFLDIYSNDGLELKDGEELAKENGDAIADNIEKAKGLIIIDFIKRALM